MKTNNYQGRGEHSVKELEFIVEQQLKHIDSLKTANQQLKLCEVGVTEGEFCGICKQSFDIVAGKICEHEQCVRYR